MNNYPDHVRTAIKLLEQQRIINEQSAEIAALRKVLGECYRRFEFYGVDRKSMVMRHIRAVLPAGVYILSEVEGQAGDPQSTGAGGSEAK